MSDNVFSAVLTFSLLAAGTVAVGSEMLASKTPAATATAVATLPTVTVIGKRIAAADTVTLPPVTITGRRLVEARVAETAGTDAWRVQ